MSTHCIIELNGGVSWEIHRKTIGKWWFDGVIVGFTLRCQTKGGGRWEIHWGFIGGSSQENHRTEWCIFRQAMFDCRMVYWIVPTCHKDQPANNSWKIHWNTMIIWYKANCQCVCHFFGVTSCSAHVQLSSDSCTTSTYVSTHMEMLCI